MNENFAGWLSTKIAELPETKVGFAKKIGISINTLNMWFRPNFRGGIRSDHITRLASGLGIPREEIISCLSAIRRKQKTTSQSCTPEPRCSGKIQASRFPSP